MNKPTKLKISFEPGTEESVPVTPTDILKRLNELPKAKTYSEWETRTVFRMLAAKEIVTP